MKDLMALEQEKHLLQEDRAEIENELNEKE